MVAFTRGGTASATLSVAPRPSPASQPRLRHMAVRCPSVPGAQDLAPVQPSAGLPWRIQSCAAAVPAQARLAQIAAMAWLIPVLPSLSGRDDTAPPGAANGGKT